METRRPKKDELKEREAEATEKETLEDLEEAFGSTDSKKSNKQTVPSPDGAFDERKGHKQSDPI